MKAMMYQILRVLAGLVALADGALLCMILLWLIGAGGVIACGKGVFDNPDWPLAVLVLVGAPLGLLIGAITLIQYCSRRLNLRRATPGESVAI